MTRRARAARAWMPGVYLVVIVCGAVVLGFSMASTPSPSRSSTGSGQDANGSGQPPDTTASGLDEIPARTGTDAPAGPPDGWERIAHEDFASSDIFDPENAGTFVSRMHSSVQENDDVLPADDGEALQRPNLRENIEIVDDPTAEDGKALGSWVRWGRYRTTDGWREGPTLSRALIYLTESREPLSFPLHFSARTRAPYVEEAMHAKYALMLWPTKACDHPVELDWQESHGRDKTLWRIAHHVDVDRDGVNVDDQKRFHLQRDMTRWHTVDVRVAEGRTTYWIDGEVVGEVDDPRWYPPTYCNDVNFSVGHRLTSQRDDPRRTPESKDLILIDSITVWQPRSADSVGADDPG